MGNIIKIDEKTQKIIKKGEEIYNPLRDSIISISGKKLTLTDKKCLSMYLSIINSDNFFKDLLENLGYTDFIDLKADKTNNENYSMEFRSSFIPFESDDYLEVLTLYLLEYPVIKELNRSRGYSIWDLKLGVYDYLREKTQNTINVQKTTKNKQKVLTRQA